jgi:hypothetical protein
MGAAMKILDGLRDAAAGNLTRVSFLRDGKQETWTRHDVDSPEGHLSMARDSICDLQTELDARDCHIDLLKMHIGDLIQHLEARGTNVDEQMTINLAKAAAG